MNESNLKLGYLLKKKTETNNKEKNEILDFLPDGAIIFKENCLQPEVGNKFEVASNESHNNHMDMSQSSN
jgi:hypothetical protein